MSKKIPDNETKLLKFPCDFPIKIVCTIDFEAESFTTNIIHKHVPEMEFIPTSINTSKQGNYQALTVVIKAKNQEQIDAIYKDLSANKAVIMVL